MSGAIIEIQDRLSQLAGKQVLLMVTDNTHSMLTAKEGAKGIIELRAHRMFLDAPQEVLDAMGSWLGGKAPRRDIIQEFIDQNISQVRTPSP